MALESPDAKISTYETIVSLLNLLEKSGEDLTNENLQDGGTLLIEGNSGARICWDMDAEKFFLERE